MIANAGTSATLERARAGWGERGAATLPTGLTYDGRVPVEVAIEKRGHRYELDDRGAAVRLAGRPPGWLEAAERAVAEVELNVNRSGVVFVPAVEGRDLAALARQVAEASLAVYSALLEL